MTLASLRPQRITGLPCTGLQFVLTVLNPKIDEMKAKASPLPPQSTSAPAAVHAPRDALLEAMTEFGVTPLPPAHMLLLNKFPIVGEESSFARSRPSGSRQSQLPGPCSKVCYHHDD